MEVIWISRKGRIAAMKRIVYSGFFTRSGMAKTEQSIAPVITTGEELYIRTRKNAAAIVIRNSRVCLDNLISIGNVVIME
jgi:hypothetical protein